jgi:cytochrome c peroxidase
MFPILNRDEMRGEVGDLDRNGQPNELAAFGDADFAGAWNGIMQRLLAIPAYVTLFRAAYPSVQNDQFTIVNAANAIGAFEAATFNTVNSPFDQYVRGDNSALSDSAKQGALLFYGKALCSKCHSGSLLTNQNFINIAVPQIGPGESPEAPLDHGQERVTGNAGDRFKFKTPPLRNVELTSPYMHDGAYTTLEAAVRHYQNVPTVQQNYDPTQLRADLRDSAKVDPTTTAAVLATLDQRVSTPLNLTDGEVQEIVAFLRSLTDPAAVDQSAEIPASVPSGLPVQGN